MLEADAKLTPISRTMATKEAAPRERTLLAKIAARRLPRTTDLPARDLWDAGDGGGFIDR